MYDLSDYGLMMGDRRRLGAYVTALRRLVKPGDVVVEIGTGPGILAVLACQLGARRVFAIEPNDVIQVARAIAAANGFADRVECIQALSTRVTLPERADVIVSDLRDVMPLFGEHIASIVDARTRLLAPGGVLIPHHDTLWAAVVSASEVYERHVGAWDGGGTGVDMGPGRAMAINAWCKARLTPEQLLVEPAQWATLDYTSVTSPNTSGTASMVVTRDGTAHGLSLWFDAHLAPDVICSNAPGQPPLLYGSAFFPWPNPVALHVGDQVHVKLRADFVSGEYIWQWESRITRGESSAPEVCFKQSTFFAQLLPASLAGGDEPVEASRAGVKPSSTVRKAVEPVDEEKLEQASSREYWSGLNPLLSIGGANARAAFEAVPAEPGVLADSAARYRDEGYFQLPPILPASVVGRMRDAVEVVRRAGWSPAFTFVYDEFWLAFRTAAIATFLESALGAGYQQIPHLWTHYVHPTPGSGGWPPHYDDPLRRDRITVWIPLTDATLDNGCMYVVPRDQVPSAIAGRLPDLDNLRMADADALLQGSRALPAASGSVLGWNFDIIHWGSICTPRACANEPRISLSQEFIARGVEPADDERPLFEAQGALPSFRERLRLIGKAILAYDHFDPQPSHPGLSERLVHDR
jgi:protein arginine N-methyltransferase 1